MTDQVQTVLKYAELQLAAEAVFSGYKDPTELGVGELHHNDDMNGIPSNKNLVSGNYRSSRFSPTEAARFNESWDLVEQISNTGTGFSGCLFKCTKDDPMTGAKAGELVLCFRSTEFMDDAVRDGEATNALEIKAEGWALGQINDMEKWFQSLKTKVASDFAAANTWGRHACVASAEGSVWGEPNHTGDRPTAERFH